MTPEDRRHSVMAHEGQILASVQHHGTAHAGEIARCVADGAVNALIRIEGPEAAAKFAFALADRAVGGVHLDPTAGPIVVPPRPRSSKMAWAHGWVIGFFCSVIAAALGRHA
jgi:hypothetical protein